MYLYNISVIIEENLEDQIISWINSEFLKTSDIEFQLLSMMDSPHPGTTICIQFKLASEEIIDEIRNQHLTKLQEFIHHNYKEKIFLFDSVMKYLPKE